MPDYKLALRARLRTDSEVAVAASRRVDWGERRQAAGFPAIRMTTISDPRPRHMTGVDRYRPVRVQIDCMALTLPEVAAMRENVLRVLLTSATVDGVRFGRARDVSVRSDGEQLEQGYVHRDQVDVVLWNDG